MPEKYRWGTKVIRLAINLIHFTQTSYLQDTVPCTYCYTLYFSSIRLSRNIFKYYFHSFLTCQLAILCYHLRLTPNILLPNNPPFLFLLPPHFKIRHIYPCTLKHLTPVFPNLYMPSTSTPPPSITLL